MADAPALHRALVDALVRRRAITDSRVEAAFRAVPRHLFLPRVPLEEVYRDQAIPTKTIDGEAVSSSSQPEIMATMLEQLGLEPGLRVLEIGAGTGYNAALMAHVVGETGTLTSMDIDDDIVDGARAHLDAAGQDRSGGGIRPLHRAAGRCPDGHPRDRARGIRRPHSLDRSSRAWILLARGDRPHGGHAARAPPVRGAGKVSLRTRCVRRSERRLLHAQPGDSV